MSDYSDEIFSRWLKLCPTENLVQRKIIPDRKFCCEQKFQKKKKKKKKKRKENIACFFRKKKSYYWGQ